MYGRAMSCDVCNKTEMLPADVDVYLVDVAPLGWIRLATNNPRLYCWKKGSTNADHSGAWDCCSIYCAESVLYDARKDIKASQEAEASA